MNVNTVYRATRGNIDKLAKWTQDQLSDLSSAIATGWNAQHNDDGSHGDITATTCACGQLKLRGFANLDVSGSTAGAPILVPAGVGLVTLRTPIAGTYNVYGIQQVGQQYGDVLYVMKNLVGGANPSFQGSANSVIGLGTTPIGTELVVIGGSTPLVTDVPVKFIYLPMGGNGSSDAWFMTY